jgi:hypothetical protein
MIAGRLPATARTYAARPERRINPFVHGR